MKKTTPKTNPLGTVKSGRLSLEQALVALDDKSIEEVAGGAFQFGGFSWGRYSGHWINELT